MSIEIKECMLTNNDCYGRATIKPKGIIVHSTGCNNPNLKRYVQPDDGIIGLNKNNNHWNRHKVEKCVHAFIGRDKNGTVRVYQTLPYTNCAWGVGKGKKGSYNFAPTGYIQFEICEDALSDSSYMLECFRLAAKFSAYLCEKYDIPTNRVISHHEAYLEGYASNHADCDKWLKKFNRDMSWFRNIVDEERIELRDGFAARIESIKIEEPKYYKVQKGDSLSKIAKAHDITLSDIKKLNPNITGPVYIIRIGQKVRVK